MVSRIYDEFKAADSNTLRKCLNNGWQTILIRFSHYDEKLREIFVISK